eukprot:scaffold47_cov258-Pinguiococcus_pyrenoidosus.AAC.113
MSSSVGRFAGRCDLGNRSIPGHGRQLRNPNAYVPLVPLRAHQNQQGHEEDESVEIRQRDRRADERRHFPEEGELCAEHDAPGTGGRDRSRNDRQHHRP